MKKCAGPPPKSTDRCQRSNARTSTGRAGAGLVVTSGRSEPPDAPKGLLQATGRAWTAFGESPAGGTAHPGRSHPSLARLFSLYDERERALRGFRRRRRLVLGSTGQPVLNPLFGAMEATGQPQILVIEDRFGLSPISRLRLGVALGDAARSLEELTRDLDVEEDAGSEQIRGSGGLDAGGSSHPLPPTLGRSVCRWIERHLVHGEGDYLGEPFRLEGWQRELIYRLYEYDAAERLQRIVRRPLLVTPRGLRQNGALRGAGAGGAGRSNGADRGWSWAGAQVAQRPDRGGRLRAGR